MSTNEAEVTAESGGPTAQERTSFVSFHTIALSIAHGYAEFQVSTLPRFWLVSGEWLTFAVVAILSELRHSIVAVTTTFQFEGQARIQYSMDTLIFEVWRILSDVSRSTRKLFLPTILDQIFSIRRYKADMPMLFPNQGPANPDEKRSAEGAEERVTIQPHPAVRCPHPLYVMCSES